MSVTAERAGSTGRAGWISALIRAGWGLGGFVAALAAVEAVVILFGIRSFVLPRPSAVLASIASMPGAYRDAIVHTGIETVSGLVAGSLFGIAMGVAFSMNRTLREMVFPIFVVSQTIPVIAFGALIVMWFGNTLQAKSVIVFYLSFFPVTVNTLLGMKAVDPRQVALLRSFGASDGAVMRRLRLPTALPHIFVSLRIAAALGLSGAVVGEWFGDTTGLGVLLLQGMYAENMEAIWASILCSALLGIALVSLITLAERRIVFWGGDEA